MFVTNNQIIPIPCKAAPRVNPCLILAIMVATRSDGPYDGISWTVLDNAEINTSEDVIVNSCGRSANVQKQI